MHQDKPKKYFLTQKNPNHIDIYFSNMQERILKTSRAIFRC